MAKGVSHLFNFLKVRILDVLIHSNKPLTTIEIAGRLNLDPHTVSNEFYHWNKCGYRYVRRLKKKVILKDGSWRYRYSITKYGIATFEMYIRRMKQNKDLNCKHEFNTGRPVRYYISINRYGFEKGLTMEEAKKIVGLAK
jgi:predicted transcriptional regulator